MITLKPIIRPQTGNDIANMSFMALLTAQKHHCFYCGKRMSLDSISRDHLFPKSKGFTLQGNLVLAHSSCNNIKANRYPTPDEIVRWVSLYSNTKRKRLLVKVLNHKPVFKLIMTQNVIDDYLN